MAYELSYGERFKVAWFLLWRATLFLGLWSFGLGLAVGSPVNQDLLSSWLT